MRRVVVTGVGVISPLGLSAGETWRNALEGKSGVGPITRFDASDFAAKIAAEVKGFDPTQYIDRKAARSMDLFTQYAVAASQEAMAHSGLTIDGSNAERVGVILGVGIGGLPELESTKETLMAGGPRKISPFFIPRLIANLAGGQVSILFGAKGPNCCHVTACAAGGHAIGDAFRAIRSGECEAMISGGTESTITPLCVGGFAAMKALSLRNDAPEKASRPFDMGRDGFVVGEGAGILILEELEAAKKRGAKILAEVVGYGRTGDAYHITAPDAEAEGAVRCMKLALADAGLRPGDVDYINAHGTSTEYNDALETKAIKKVFGEDAYRVKISSTKSMTGHLLGAAGGLEAVLTVLALQEGRIPPTINYETPDPACDLDYTPNRTVAVPLRAALSNSFGFGGTNACLAFKRYQG